MCFLCARFVYYSLLLLDIKNVLQHIAKRERESGGTLGYCPPNPSRGQIQGGMRQSNANGKAAEVQHSVVPFPYIHNVFKTRTLHMSQVWGVGGGGVCICVCAWALAIRRSGSKTNKVTPIIASDVRRRRRWIVRLARA